MINIANLLRNAKPGIILWSPLFGPVEFMQLGEDDQIWVRVDNCEPFDKYGRYFGSRFAEAECLLFPSNKIRSWVGWEAPVEPKFKVGDWITDGNITIQIEDIRNNSYIYSDGVLYSTKTVDKVYHLWTIEDAQDGDVLVYEDEISLFRVTIINWLHGQRSFGGFHYHFCFDGKNRFVNGFYSLTEKDKCHITPATSKQRNLLFKKIQEAGYQWYAGKKELRKIKPHYDIANFKPFDKVLVRDRDNLKWTADLFSYIDDSFVCTGGISSRQCIPFEGNEHLLGTTDMPSEEYINWQR